MSRETKLGGEVIAKVRIGNDEMGRDTLVKVYVEVPAEYFPDWQEDAHSFHDEGFYEYDMKDATVPYPDEFKVVTTYGFSDNTFGKISKILEIFSQDLEEVA